MVKVDMPKIHENDHAVRFDEVANLLDEVERLTEKQQKFHEKNKDKRACHDDTLLLGTGIRVLECRSGYG